MKTEPAFTRRRMLAFAGAATLAPALAACAGTTPAPRSAGKVVVIGGGFGGATAAKYLRLWSQGRVAVTLVEPNHSFVSCPISNLVIGGSRTLADITVGYQGLRRWGVNVVHDTVAAIDAERGLVRLASGIAWSFDRAVVSPGIDFMYEQVQGMSADATTRVPHAWKAGAQTVLLRRQLEAMPDGGVVAMSIPLAPYRCPPGPYERACQIAWYLKHAKPRSKLVVLDANPQIVSKGPLFTRAWKDAYDGILEYRADAAVAEVDVAGRTFVLERGDRVRADVLNLIPPMRAGDIARTSGLVTANGRWCEVDWTTLESVAVPNVHVIGDATLSAPAMPKSGHMANQHGKAAAAAIVELFDGRRPEPPTMVNTCYSYVDDRHAIHVSSVHRFDAEKRTLVSVGGSGGVSTPERAQWALEGRYANGWAQSIWADMLA
jgi:NADPH-dependent 2,4-dienoyl-CoA reductase/sulfur reductase-like enzyme